ncbi:MAG: ATP-binding protein [Chloroflexota bacterium]
MPRKVTTKLALIIAFVGIIGAVLLAAVQQILTTNAILEFTADPNVQTITLMLSGLYELNGSLNGAPTLLENRDRTLYPPHVPIAVVDAGGTIVYGEDDFNTGTPFTDEGTTDLYPIMAGDEQVGTLVLGPITLSFESIAVQNFRASLRMASITGLLVALVVSFTLGAGFARSLTAPLKKLTQAARRMAAGQLSQKVEIQSQDEMGDLATAFNQMSHDLDRSLAARKQMTADIAHDLRTPLAVLMGYTEPLKDGRLKSSPELFKVMHEEANHLKHLVDDLHTLAVADTGGLSLSFQTIKPDLLLEDAMVAYTNLANQRQIQLTLHASEIYEYEEIFVDPVRITQVLNNLMMNALTHTPAGGEIRLHIEEASDKRFVAIKVSDTGVGIPADQLPHIFDRFYRADQARTRTQGATNSGLGLAICRSIIETHGGKIEVESALGMGTTFIILLPALRSGD